MTEIQFPSGQIIDFEDATEDQIKQSVTVLRQKNPELFEQGEVNYSDMSFDEIAERGESSQVDLGTQPSEKIKATHSGEVKDLGLSYFVGRGDTDEDRLARLQTVFGQQGVTKVGPDDFFLNLDNITEDVKDKYNLPESGTIRFNEPGLGWQDVASFLGRETVPLVAALGASVAATGLGFGPGVLLVGAAGAAGKAVDEFIIEDIFEGLQRQDTSEVLFDVALQGLIEAGGEGVGRGIVAGVKWALKGSGPIPDSVRVQELADTLKAQGYSERQANRLARKAAKEEASSTYRKMIDEGANIPAVTLTGKSILGRTQAIWESIFPNDVAVARNVDFVRKIIDDEKKGLINTNQAREAIAETAESMVARLRETMADPNAAVKQANKELTSVLEKEFDTLSKVLDDTTSGSQGLATEFQRGLELSVNLFTARSNQLYRNADAALDDATIDASGIQSVLKQLQKDPLSGGDKLQGGIWKFISENKEIPIAQVPALRAALRASEADPTLLGTPAGANIKKMLDAIDESVKRKEISLAEQLTKGPLTSPAKIAQTREGLDLLAAANKHYADGAEIINSGFIKGLNTQIKQKNIQDLTGIVDLVVRENQPQLLKFVLDSVQPSGKEVNKIIEAGRANPGVFRELSEQIVAGDIKGVADRLDDLGLSSAALERAGIKPEKAMLTVPSVFSKLPKNDPTRVRLQNDFSDVLKLYDEMSSAAAGPSQFRDGFRSLLANTWLKNSTKINRSDSGINYGALASSFDLLGPKVQKELFGNQTAEFRRVMNDLKILDKDSVSRLNEFSGQLFNQDARTILETFKGTVRQAEAESQDAFLKAMAGGPIDAEKLVTNVLANPKNFETLRRRLGDQVLGLTDDAPLGSFKDIIISRIISPAFPAESVTDDVVRSGSWGQVISKNVKDLNRGGALESVLGKSTLDDINKLAKAGEVISDSVMRGKTGLAAAGYSAGFATALFLSPIATLTGAAGIFAMSRLLRTKPVMKYLTSPRLRAYEAQRAIKAGADLSGFGQRNLAAERARESAFRSLRTILVDAGYYATDQGLNVAEQRATEQFNQATQAPAAPAQPPAAMPAAPAQPPAAVDPGPPIPDYLKQGPGQPNPLYQQEINKLLGMTP